MGVWEADFATGAFRASAAAIRLHGLAPDAIVDVESAFDVVVREDRDRIRAAVMRATQEATAYLEDARIITSAGNTRWLEECGRGLANWSDWA